VRAQLPDREEEPRVFFASVPYALKAVDAETLGGRPLSAFLMASDVRSQAAGGLTASGPTASLAGVGTTNRITKWVDDNGTLRNSILAEAGENVGIGTTAPNGKLHVVGVGNELKITRLRSTGATNDYGLFRGP
jgi:trimeric autotransporter adhesin